MHVTVIIATINRPELVAKTLRHLAAQTRQPDQIVLSAPDLSHLGGNLAELAPDGVRVRCVTGARGLCAQRNAALDSIGRSTDVIVFFDDDFLPSPDYIDHLAEAFDNTPDFAVIMGYAIADGASGSGIRFDDGVALLATADDVTRDWPLIADHPGAYGCNMAIRASAVDGERFDERLPLYGWQEDIDFTSRLRRRGRIVALKTLTGVHLGVKGGRVSGLRLGYSQIVNPIYLIRKGTMGLGFGGRLMVRNLAANVLRSLRPEPWVDRRGRLRGNLLAAAHVLCGRVDPEYILQLQDKRS